MHYTSAKTTYTPDGMPVLGMLGGGGVGGDGGGGGGGGGGGSTAVAGGGVPPMFAVSGCNGYGVTWSGGFGRVIAEALLGINALPAEIAAARYDTWTAEEVKEGAAEKRRTKFGTWPAAAATQQYD